MDLLTKIGIGTVQFGIDYGISNQNGKTPKNEVIDIFKAAYGLKINLIDTAIAYGDAEIVIGNCDTDSFNIVSKFMDSEKYGSVSSQLNESLKNLKASRLHGYLAHRPMSLIENPKDWEELIKLKKEGKIEKIGFSLNTTNELQLLIDKGLKPDLIQVPYNYFDKRFEKLMIKLKKEGCEVHSRSTFLQGLFFMKPAKLSSFFNDIKPIIEKLQNDNKYLAGALLKYVLKKDFIDKVIVGVENSQQLIQNISDLKNAEKLEEFNLAIKNEIVTPFLWEK